MKKNRADILAFAGTPHGLVISPMRDDLVPTETVVRAASPAGH